MEEHRGLGAGGDSSSSRVASSCDRHGDRTRFTVELRPGETTIVSWKKLMKDVPKDNAVVAAVEPVTPPPEAHPALESRLAPGQPAANELKDAAAPNRFNSVIEKIERLYMGKDSSDDEELGDVPDDDQYDTEDSFIDDAELDEYFEVDKAKTKHDGFFINKGKLENIELSSLPPQQPRKRRRKETAKAIGESVPAHETNNESKTGKKEAGQIAPSMESNSVQTSGSPSGTNPPKTGGDGSGHVRYQEKSGSGHLKPQTGKTSNAEQSFLHIEKNGKRELIDLNVAASKLPMKTSLFPKRESSSFFKPKNATLDKALRELEKTVAESRPPVKGLRYADATSQAVKRRLSQEIKQKLAKVVRAAPTTSNGKVPIELLVHLMGILGHLVNVRTLKRNVKILSSSSLSVSKEKDEKFQQIKRDIVDMIKTHTPPPTSKAAAQQFGSSDDFQEPRQDKGVIKVKYTLDPALEDKICDLYDIFVDGLDEDVAPLARKLYAELAAMWPKGAMDNHGIKHAICRSKERRKTPNDKNKEQEIVKRKKVVAQKTEEKIQAESSNERAFASVSSTSTPAIMTLALAASSLKPDKIKGSSSSPYIEIRSADGTVVKKKLKRKAETDPREARSLHNEHKQKSSHKQHSTGQMT